MFCNHTKILGNVKHLYESRSDLLRPFQHASPACYLLLYAPRAPSAHLKRPPQPLERTTSAPFAVQTTTLLCTLLTRKSWSSFMALLTSLSRMVFPKYSVNSYCLTSSVCTSSETIIPTNPP